MTDQTCDGCGKPKPRCLRVKHNRTGQVLWLCETCRYKPEFFQKVSVVTEAK